MLRLLIGLFFFILVFAADAQSLSVREEWKNVLQTRKFSVKKNKGSLPYEVLRALEIDTISELAHRWEKWNGSCVGNEQPQEKLNWAATDGKDWIISISSGGYSLKTIYYFVQPGREPFEVMVTGTETPRFKKFKRSFINDKLTKGQALY